MARAKNTEQFEVDRLRDRLSRDAKAEFDRFLALEPSWYEIGQWLKERTGEDVAIAKIAVWQDSTRPPGAEASALNVSFEEYQGLKLQEAARATLGFSLNFLNKIRTSYIDSERFDQLNTVQAVGMVPGMIREVRSLIEQLEKKELAYDAMQMELGGAAFALQELLIAHRDTPLEEPIRALGSEIFKKIRAKYTGIS